MSFRVKRYALKMETLCTWEFDHMITIQYLLWRGVVIGEMGARGWPRPSIV